MQFEQLFLHTLCYLKWLSMKEERIKILLVQGVFELILENISGKLFNRVSPS